MKYYQRCLILCLVVLFICGSISSFEQESSSREKTQKSISISEKEETGYKEYFNLTDPSSIIGLLVLALMMVMCTLGGIGGGVVILPVCLTLFKFNPHVAIAHTTLFSTISSATRIAYEMVNSSGGKKRINFDVTLLCCGPTILGAFLGVFMNKMSPDALILIVTVLLLSWLFFKSVDAYKERSANEAKKEKEMREKSSQNGGESKGIVEKKSKGAELGEKTIKIKENEKKLHDQYEFHRGDIPILCFLLAVNPIISLIRGNKMMPSILGIQKCSSVDYLVIFMLIVLLVVITFRIKKRLVERNKFVVQNPDNVDFTGEKLTYSILTMFVVGFIGSFLSVGSSSLLTFSLIMLGMPPFCASPASLLVGIIYGSAAAVIFFLEGQIYPSSALFGGLMVIAGTLTTRATIYEAFLKKGKGSVILLFISIMMVLCVVLSIVQVYPKIKSEYYKGVDIWALRTLC